VVFEGFHAVLVTEKSVRGLSGVCDLLFFGTAEFFVAREFLRDVKINSGGQECPPHTQGVLAQQFNNPKINVMWRASG